MNFSHASVFKQIGLLTQNNERTRFLSEIYIFASNNIPSNLDAPIGSICIVNNPSNPGIFFKIGPAPTQWQSISQGIINADTIEYNREILTNNNSNTDNDLHFSTVAQALDALLYANYNHSSLSLSRLKITNFLFFPFLLNSLSDPNFNISNSTNFLEVGQNINNFSFYYRINSHQNLLKSINELGNLFFKVELYELVNNNFTLILEKNILSENFNTLVSQGDLITFSNSNLLSLSYNNPNPNIFSTTKTFFLRIKRIDNFYVNKRLVLSFVPRISFKKVFENYDFNFFIANSISNPLISNGTFFVNNSSFILNNSIQNNFNFEESNTPQFIYFAFPEEFVNDITPLNFNKKIFFLDENKLQIPFTLLFDENNYKIPVKINNLTINYLFFKSNWPTASSINISIEKK